MSCLDNKVQFMPRPVTAVNSTVSSGNIATSSGLPTTTSSQNLSQAKAAADGKNILPVVSSHSIVSSASGGQRVNKFWMISSKSGIRMPTAISSTSVVAGTATASARALQIPVKSTVLENIVTKPVETSKHVLEKGKGDGPNTLITHQPGTLNYFTVDGERVETLPGGSFPPNPKITRDHFIKAAADKTVPGTRLQYRTPGANGINKSGNIKRPMNAFMCWAREERQKLCESMPYASNSDISITLGKIWNELPKDKKQRYFDEAEAIKEKHRQEYPGWTYKPKPKRYRYDNLGKRPSLYQQWKMDQEAKRRKEEDIASGLVQEDVPEKISNLTAVDYSNAQGQNIINIEPCCEEPIDMGRKFTNINIRPQGGMPSVSTQCTYIPQIPSSKKTVRTPAPVATQLSKLKGMGLQSTNVENKFSAAPINMTSPVNTVATKMASSQNVVFTSQAGTFKVLGYVSSAPKTKSLGSIKSQVCKKIIDEVEDNMPDSETIAFDSSVAKDFSASPNSSFTNAIQDANDSLQNVAVHSAKKGTMQMTYITSLAHAQKGQFNVIQNDPRNPAIIIPSISNRNTSPGNLTPKSSKLTGENKTNSDENMKNTATSNVAQLSAVATNELNTCILPPFNIFKNKLTEPPPVFSKNSAATCAPLRKKKVKKYISKKSKAMKNASRLPLQDKPLDLTKSQMDLLASSSFDTGSDLYFGSNEDVPIEEAEIEVSSSRESLMKKASCKKKKERIELQKTKETSKDVSISCEERNAKVVDDINNQESDNESDVEDDSSVVSMASPSRMADCSDITVNLPNIETGSVFPFSLYPYSEKLRRDAEIANENGDKFPEPIVITPCDIPLDLTDAGSDHDDDIPKAPPFGPSELQSCGWRRTSPDLDMPQLDMSRWVTYMNEISPDHDMTSPGNKKQLKKSSETNVTHDNNDEVVISNDAETPKTASKDKEVTRNCSGRVTRSSVKKNNSGSQQGTSFIELIDGINSKKSSDLNQHEKQSDNDGAGGIDKENSKFKAFTSGYINSSVIL